MNRLFVDNLTVIDFSYFHPTRGVVGESWIVDVELQGELNEEGMVFDFGHVKKLLKKALDEGMDHCFAIPLQLTGLNYVENPKAATVDIQYLNSKGELKFAYQSPREAVFLIDSDKVTIDTAKPLLEKHLNALVPSNVKQVKLNLRVEEIDGDFYHYSHGLKKHQGDCQRICHGHRSRIEIFKNNQRDHDSESEWSKRFADVYIITTEDLCGPKNEDLLHVGYNADQGRFDVWLNPAQCYFIDTDSTVELIASHIAQRLFDESPQHEWRVKAFEGVQKGAIAVRAP